jgi:hypothetical protein
MLLVVVIKVCCTIQAPLFSIVNIYKTPQILRIKKENINQ